MKNWCKERRRRSSSADVFRANDVPAVKSEPLYKRQQFSPLSSSSFLLLPSASTQSAAVVAAAVVAVVSPRARLSLTHRAEPRIPSFLLVQTHMTQKSSKAMAKENLSLFRRRLRTLGLVVYC